MNIMNELTRKHMRKNKKRTLMTIIGVIISVAMITAVSTASVTFLDFLQRMEMDQNGEWHVQYNEVPVKELTTLEEENTKYIFYTQALSYGKINGTEIENSSKPYLYVEQFTPDAMEKMNLKLVEGRFPENSREIVIPEHLISNGNVALEVGNTVQITLGDRYIEEYRPENLLMQANPYDSENNNEKFHENETATYTVVGIMKRPELESYSAPGYTVITYLDQTSLKDSDQVTAYTFLNHVTKKVYEESVQTAERIGLSEWSVNYNDSVLRYYGVTPYDGFNIMVQGMAFILILIIMVGSISLIYNSFAISITERSKQFGMLSSVGATRKQKRNAIFYEGSVIGIIAIPIGIFAGIAGMAVTFRLVGTMISNAFDIEVPLRMCVSVSAIVVAIIFSVVTIYISALIPARKAAKISAIEAIRQTKDIKLGRNAGKSSPLIRWMFGLEGDLAQKNLKRNKKRYRALMFSLFISFVLFTSVGSYVFYLSNALNMTTDERTYDILISMNENSPNTILNPIKQIEGVKEATHVKELNTTFSIQDAEKWMKKSFIETRQQLYKMWGWDKEDIDLYLNESKESLLGVKFITLDQESYEAYTKQLGLSAEREGDDELEGIVINKARNEVTYSVIESEVLNVKENNILPIYLPRYDYEKIGEDGQYELVEEIPIPIKVKAVSDQTPLGVFPQSIDFGVVVIVNEDTLNKIYEKVKQDPDIVMGERYYLNLNNPEGMGSKLGDMLKEQGVIDYYMIDRYEEAQKEQQLVTVMSIFAYGFISLISLICMANLCNTIATSFALRRREFAMLKSVGMDPKAFNKMIRLESMLYGIKALLYGVPVSIFMTVQMYKVVNKNFMTKFVFPWTTYIVGAMFVFIIVGVAMVYASSKVKGESIIHGLKSEIE